MRAFLPLFVFRFVSFCFVLFCIGSLAVREVSSETPPPPSFGEDGSLWMVTSTRERIYVSQSGLAKLFQNYGFFYKNHSGSVQ
uniref:Uncharacterized protein n=1 Tax=Arundo donax TaxID=35708 RepID=A0A0A9GHR2_ARUDO